LSRSDKSIHDLERCHVGVGPRRRLEHKGDVGVRSLSPCAHLTTDVIRLLTIVILVFGHCRVVPKTFADELNVFTMVLDTVGDDKAFSRSNVVHDELLENAGIEVSNVLTTAISRHSETVIAKSSAQNILLLVSVGVHFQHVVVQIMCLLVLHPGNVSSHHAARLKGNIDHHLEHVGDVVLDAASLEEGALLVVVHLHVATAHLNHSVVDSFIGVLKRFEVGVFQGEKGT